MSFSKIQFPGSSNFLSLEIKPFFQKRINQNHLMPTVASSGFDNLSSQTATDIRWNRTFAIKMDAIRLVAIASIVWGHTLFAWENRVFQSPFYNLIQLVFMQLGRVGTINFFIISGFFFSDKLNKFTVLQYLKYRLHSLIIPWLIFIMIFVIIQVFQLYSFQQFIHTGFNNLAVLVFNLFKAAVFHAAFWFIPVSLICAIFLLIGKRYINRLWFGILLLAITLFYCINLYHGWVSVNHVRSFLGYVFFMWAGVQLKNNLSLVKSFIEDISWRILIPLIPLAFALACMEGSHLKTIGCSDAFGSLRLSNAFLSVLIFISLSKKSTIYTIKKLKPQKYVYGIYLIHSIILLEIMPLANKFISQDDLFNKMPLMILFQISAFFVLMILSYFVAVTLKKSRLHLLIGR